MPYGRLVAVRLERVCEHLSNAHVVLDQEELHGSLLRFVGDILSFQRLVNSFQRLVNFFNVTADCEDAILPFRKNERCRPTGFSGKGGRVSSDQVDPADGPLAANDTRVPLLDGSPQMRAIRTVIENIADTDATVLIRGESGVGKDLVARAIHAASARHGGPFVKVNCAAIPPGLLESELFGHEKGAFTGAHRRKPGQFEYANKGTIYLDEIAELPLALQAKLLHVLQDFRFARVGGNALVDVDTRVIAATNRDLEHAMTRGEFREDLYYRLNVVEIHIPPLRERKALGEVLEQVQWNRAEASRILRVSYKTLLNKISECELTPPSRRRF